MFEAFSGFFTFEECYQALKACNLDIAEATNWLVDEGEREREKKEITKKKTLLLCESEVVN
jgi:translation elongation factor EF-Ts